MESNLHPGEEMTYSESARGLFISVARATLELRRHSMGPAEIAECFDEITWSRDDENRLCCHHSTHLRKRGILTMTTTTEAATEIRKLTIRRLANLAECAGPDSEDSAGAKFLDYVRDGVAELVEEFDENGSAPRDLDDRIAEIADGAPDVYTHTMWAEFTDLAAYREDPTDLGAEADDMDKCARVCLYIIAERLARQLVIEFAPELDES